MNVPDQVFCVLAKCNGDMTKARPFLDTKGEPSNGNALLGALTRGGGALHRQLEGPICLPVVVGDKGSKMEYKMLSLSRPWSEEEGRDFSKVMLEEIRLTKKLFFPNVAKVNY